MKNFDYSEYVTYPKIDILFNPLEISLETLDRDIKNLENTLDDTDNVLVKIGDNVKSLPKLETINFMKFYRLLIESNERVEKGEKPISIEDIREVIDSVFDRYLKKEDN